MIWACDRVLGDARTHCEHQFVHRLTEQFEMTGRPVRGRAVGFPGAFVRGLQRRKLPGVQSFNEGGKIAEDQ